MVIVEALGNEFSEVKMTAETRLYVRRGRYRKRGKGKRQLYLKL